MSDIKRIALLTSGGDAPGMNAAVRAVVRSCVYYNAQAVGVYEGYNGLVNGNFRDLSVRSVNNILGNGGTFLRSSRCPEFRTVEGRKQAYDNMRQNKIDGLIAIGGDGTFAGAHVFGKEFGIQIAGIPATIDNDIAGTDYSIGYDSASNIVVSCIDKIRDTALSHNRLFFVEVMGRDTGFIALRSGIASGAVCIMMPERPVSVEELVAILRKGFRNKKSSSIVVVAEGNANGGAIEIAKAVQEKYTDYETKVTILGHLQRGGDPSCFDRVIASEMGVAAVEGLLSGNTGFMTSYRCGKIVQEPIETSYTQKKKINEHLVKIAQILSI
ncbi:MAG: 6-phosphofructokinase [Saprospirales bacterium]|nr:MAG: 6-phosphofructokinase [Saprospirales bacterium]